MELRPFHIAFPVASLDDARAFYGGVLECPEARSTDNWVDFDLFGNSLSAYLHPEEAARTIPSSLVDVTDSPKRIPVRHFGVVLSWEEWEAQVDKLRGKGVEFILGPLVRFAGRNGEQATVYFEDPCNNVVEFKAFRNPDTRFLPFAGE
ncbi:glyoxalase [Streptomyces rectiverticillatus]|uniref:VOC family protein n=1 Tax=Streptomyces rectiverticillatus TaxID=173860 RepID=UPI0015C3E0EA|nr:VOC family protein [Streptomyces rectiverticillatus]QLE70299.1 glyoxalase [Streptomyces rectiverticillatus]